MFYTVPTILEMAKQALRHREVDYSNLHLVGPMVIHDIGEENFYFTSVWFGTEHFVKYQG
jgi:hypothetical protein